MKIKVEDISLNEKAKQIAENGLFNTYAFLKDYERYVLKGEQNPLAKMFLINAVNEAANKACGESVFYQSTMIEELASLVPGVEKSELFKYCKDSRVKLTGEVMLIDYYDENKKYDSSEKHAQTRCKERMEREKALKEEMKSFDEFPQRADTEYFADTNKRENHQRNNNSVARAGYHKKQNKPIIVVRKPKKRMQKAEEYSDIEM